MIFAKLSTSDLLKTKTFKNKDYDVSFSVHEVANVILTRASSYISNLVIRQSFLILEKLFLQGWSWLKFNDLGLVVGTEFFKQH